jgi:hypothetical protein
MVSERRRLVCGVMLLALFVGCGSRTAGSSSTGSTTLPMATAVAGSIPATYQSIYTTLQQYITGLSSYLNGVTASAGAAPLFGAHLLVTDSNRGPALLAPGILASANTYLDRFKELGIQGVTLEINFPILLPSFPQAAQYLALYTSVAQAVRQHGMHLAVEQMLFSPTPRFRRCRSIFRA